MINKMVVKELEVKTKERDMLTIGEEKYNGLQFVHFSEGSKIKVIYTKTFLKDGTTRKYLDIMVNGVSISYAGVNTFEFSKSKPILKEEKTLYNKN